MRYRQTVDNLIDLGHLPPLLTKQYPLHFTEDTNVVEIQMIRTRSQVTKCP